MVDDETQGKRLGFWLRIARERSGKSQAGAAEALDLKASSKSTISDWENGAREPALRQLRVLARYYGVPLSLFIDPPQTAFEDVDRLVDLAAAAIGLEQQDWEGERGRDPSAADGPDGRRDRRTA